MGLDCSHNAWHGSYGAFMRWRKMVAKVAGLPPLELMEGFYEPLDIKTNEPGMSGKAYLGNINERLPISWDVLKPSPLHELLYHSDCDGGIPAESCGHIADALETLIPMLPDEDVGGHIGNWRTKTQQFVNGLRAAEDAKEPLLFG